MSETDNTNIENKSSSIVLVGNPNVGKSVIFGFLTGKYVTVSNFPGTTVEISQGKATLNNEKYTVIDTPGTNSFVPQSEDEKVARDVLLDDEFSTVLQVGDFKNLNRTLFVTIQLMEMELPVVLDLNMEDEALSRGIRVDKSKLSELLEIPVFSTTATRRKGLPQLKKSLTEPKVSGLKFKYPGFIENGIKEIEPLLPEANISKRALALMILSRDTSLTSWLDSNFSAKDIKKVNGIVEAAGNHTGDSPGAVISKTRMNLVTKISEQVFNAKKSNEKLISVKLGELSMHPVWGIFFVFFALYLTYWFVGLLGAGTIVDFFENGLFQQYINPFFINVFDKILPFDHVHTFENITWELTLPLTAANEINTGIALSREVITPEYILNDGVDLTAIQSVIRFIHDFLIGKYGMITMALSYGFAIVLPIVGTFFILFSLMEDSGYLPRLAVMLNRLFKMIGLNGKAILPMVLGLGCDTMATMTTRIMQTRKERVIVTLLLALGIPCSAQLGVLLGMIGSISAAGTLVWVFLIGSVICLVGFLASKVIKGDSSEFILELPPIRKPVFGNILVKTMARIEWYFKEVIPLFILGTAVLFFLDITGALIVIRDFSSPLIVSFLGLPIETADAFLIGFLRRDYGAVYLLDAAMNGLLNPNQILISMVTITLFVPCIANVFIIIKELGMKTALRMVTFIFPFAFLVGGLLNLIIRVFGINF